MREVVSFQPPHLVAVAKTVASALRRDGIRAEHGLDELQQLESGEHLQAAGENWSLVEGSRVIACGGLLRDMRGLGLAWAVIDPAATGADMLVLHRAAARALARSGYRRVHATADPQHASAGRWLRLLGFRSERLLAEATPAGNCQMMYVRRN